MWNRNHDHIALSTHISTKRKKVSDAIFMPTPKK